MKETSANEFKISFQFSFSQRNGFAQRAMAVIRLPRTNRLVLSESECHTLCTKHERYNFRDKYEISHRRISSEEHKYVNIQRSKIASHFYPEIKHLH